MTELNKPISRKTTIMLDNRINARNRDRITVTLYPTNQIGFRAYNCRKEVRLDLSVAYKAALELQAKEELRRKRDEAIANGKRPRSTKVFRGIRF